MNWIPYIFTIFILSGCGSAQLVSSRYQPTKRGTIKMDIPGPAQTGMVKEQARQIMAKFCAPQTAVIVGTDTQTQMDGVYANPLIGNSANFSYSDAKLVHFECADRPNSEKSGSLDL